jgi:hypothetical protein
MRSFALLCLAATACSDASKQDAPVPVSPGPPARLVPIAFSGTAQVTTTQRIIMQVRDAGDVRVPGTLVTWTVVGGGGVFAPVSSTTDTAGLATTTYTLAQTTGPVHLRATLATGATQDFDLKALPGPLAELTPLYTDLTLRAGATFSGRVRAVDGYGNGIPGVLLTSRQGDVQYTNIATTPTSPATQTTDSGGYVTFTGTVAAVPGFQSFLIDGPEVASETGLSSAFFAWFRVRASADQGFITPAALQGFTIAVISGATVAVNVVVIRADGQPAANAPVTFSVPAGNGSIIDESGSVSLSSSTSTDIYSGTATVKWHVPVTAGTYMMSATTPAPNDGRSPLVITAVVH